MLRSRHVLRQRPLRRRRPPLQRRHRPSLLRRERGALVVEGEEEAEGEGVLPAGDPVEGALEGGEPTGGEDAEDVAGGEAGLIVVVVLVVGEGAGDERAEVVGTVAGGGEELVLELLKAGNPGVKESLH